VARGRTGIAHCVFLLHDLNSCEGDVSFFRKGNSERFKIDPMLSVVSAFKSDVVVIVKLGTPYNADVEGSG
jgi:preprotein translocase subunit Sec61beta